MKIKNLIIAIIAITAINANYNDDLENYKSKKDFQIFKLIHKSNQKI